MRGHQTPNHGTKGTPRCHSFRFILTDRPDWRRKKDQPVNKKKKITEEEIQQALQDPANKQRLENRLKEIAQKSREAEELRIRSQNRISELKAEAQRINAELETIQGLCPEIEQRRAKLPTAGDIITQEVHPLISSAAAKVEEIRARI